MPRTQFLRLGVIARLSGLTYHACRYRARQEHWGYRSKSGRSRYYSVTDAASSFGAQWTDDDIAGALQPRKIHGALEVSP
ncbi:MAG: hypothetical protein JSR78_15190 [Proteobacteria bacterium]|nr:hypothetical protein [Pseudomonadota bacterium]